MFVAENRTRMWKLFSVLQEMLSRSRQETWLQKRETVLNGKSLQDTWERLSLILIVCFEPRVFWPAVWKWPLRPSSTPDNWIYKAKKINSSAFICIRPDLISPYYQKISHCSLMIKSNRGLKWSREIVLSKNDLSSVNNRRGYWIFLD